MIKLIFLIPFLLLSCTKFVQMTDNKYYEVVDPKNHNFIDIIFSHNINGETHPCGCRQFPLGGMAQANGIIESNTLKAPTIYVDTGDTFFESTVVPDFIKKSSEFKARKIAEALDKKGLKILTPGDQDFSMGESFLEEISKKHKFKFLISNSSKKMKIKHQQLIRIDTSEVSLFFIGVVLPDLLKEQHKELFISPIKAIDKQLKIINTKYKEIKNKRIILLSHSGFETDKIYAQKFSELSWIIGSHSQTYLRFSHDENKSQIVQGLSRNHYLGKISISLNQKKKDKYELLEVKDESKNLIKNNKMIAWLDEYKSQLNQVHKNEQAGQQNFQTDNSIPTYISCSDCHENQVDFWQGTTHSMAYSTLLNAKEANNPSCVKCHSVGMNQKGGFSTQANIVRSDKKDFNHEKYWKEFTAKIKVKHPLRKLKAKDIKKLAQVSMKRDKDLEITHNFSNVQCLNCHNQTGEHPFDTDAQKLKVDYQAKCISCHTTDQSPEWYDKDSKGLATSLNQKYFAKKLKEVSCPKIE